MIAEQLASHIASNIDSRRSELLSVLDRLDSMFVADQLVLLDVLSTHALNFYRERYDSDFLNYQE